MCTKILKKHYNQYVIVVFRRNEEMPEGRK